MPRLPYVVADPVSTPAIPAPAGVGRGTYAIGQSLSEVAQALTRYSAASGRMSARAAAIRAQKALNREAIALESEPMQETDANGKPVLTDGKMLFETKLERFEARSEEILKNERETIAFGFFRDSFDQDIDLYRERVRESVMADVRDTYIDHTRAKTVEAMDGLAELAIQARDPGELQLLANQARGIMEVAANEGAYSQEQATREILGWEDMVQKGVTERVHAHEVADAVDVAIQQGSESAALAFLRGLPPEIAKDATPQIRPIYAAKKLDEDRWKKESRERVWDVVTDPDASINDKLDAVRDGQAKRFLSGRTAKALLDEIAGDRSEPEPGEFVGLLELAGQNPDKFLRETDDLRSLRVTESNRRELLGIRQQIESGDRYAPDSSAGGRIKTFYVSQFGEPTDKNGRALMAEFVARGIRTFESQQADLSRKDEEDLLRSMTRTVRQEGFFFDDETPIFEIDEVGEIPDDVRQAIETSASRMGMDLSDEELLDHARELLSARVRSTGSAAPEPAPAVAPEIARPKPVRPVVPSGLGTPAPSLLDVIPRRPLEESHPELVPVRDVLRQAAPAAKAVGRAVKETFSPVFGPMASDRAEGE